MIARDVHHVAERYLEALDTPVALSVAILMKYGEWDQVAGKRIDPRTYSEALSWKFHRDYLAVELMRKYPGMPLEADRRANAVAQFWASEAQCAKTNLRLLPYLTDPQSEDCEVAVLKFIKEVRNLVGFVLGGLPQSIDARFGPGSTFETRGHPCASNLTLGDKLEMGIHCTASLLPLTKFLYETAWGRATVRRFPDRSAPQVCRGNRYFTVPKDATIERGACAEPGGNVAVQLSLGREIRARLMKVGIDLDRGQEIHGRLAERASRDGTLATLDLSSASDTVAKTLVKLLLPEKWWLLLSAARSPLTQIDGRWVYLEKFSSMGNGFTFELETLIFWAISTVASGFSNVLVYGDDIIVPTDRSADVLAALKFFGFTPNPRKTFTVGCFRESCGTDAFNGVVTHPFRWDSVPECPSDWITVHNSIRRALKWVVPGSHHPMRAAESKVPREVRLCRGPEELGDLVLHEDLEENWTTRLRMHRIPRRGLAGPFRMFRVWQPVGIQVSLDHFTLPFQLALGLYGTSSDGIAPRGVMGYRLGWVPYS